MNTQRTSNQPEVGRWLAGILDGFDFTARLGGGTLAQAIQQNHAEQIQERSVTEQRGAISEFRPNSPAYAARKLEEFGSSLVNVRTGAMLSNESLEGRLDVNGTELVHRYGTGRPGDPNRGRRSRPRGRAGSLEKTQTEPTDVAKANWAAGDGRGFFELDHEIKRRNIELVGEALVAYVRAR